MVDSFHKKPEMWIVFPCHDIIMYHFRLCHIMVLIHWGWDEMATILQMTFSFSCMKIVLQFKFQRNLFLRVQLLIYRHWFILWLGTQQATSLYLNQWLPSLLMYICVTRPQWVKALFLCIQLALYTIHRKHCTNAQYFCPTMTDIHD